MVSGLGLYCCLAWLGGSRNILRVYFFAWKFCPCNILVFKLINDGFEDVYLYTVYLSWGPLLVG